MIDHPYSERGVSGFGLRRIPCCTQPASRHPVKISTERTLPWSSCCGAPVRPTYIGETLTVYSCGQCGRDQD